MLTLILLLFMFMLRLLDRSRTTQIKQFDIYANYVHTGREITYIKKS